MNEVNHPSLLSLSLASINLFVDSFPLSSTAETLLPPPFSPQARWNFNTTNYWGPVGSAWLFLGLENLSLVKIEIGKFFLTGELVIVELF